MNHSSLKLLVPFVCLAVASSALAQSGAVAATPPGGAPVTLKVGNPAPAMTVKKWIKGSPVTKLGDGAVNVVEFWATWCGPCRESIPHLTELAHKYKGKATFTGVSVFEQPDPKDESYMPKVASFVKDMGDKMDYNVGADGMSGTMGKTWMEAAGQEGIPTAFVIDQKGTVVWIGHPMNGLDEVVGQVIDGKFDPKAEEDRKAKEQQKMEQLQKDLMPVMEAMQAKKMDVAVKALDGIIAKYPDMADRLSVGKLSLMLQYDEPGGYAFAKTLLKGSLKDNVQFLQGVSLLLLNIDGKLKHPDFPTALLFAKRALDAGKGKDAISMHVYSMALFKVGEAETALSVETQALALAKANPDSIPPDAISDMEKHLEIYKAKVAKK